MWAAAVNVDISPNTLGFTAGLFTTLSSVPQLMRSLRTRSMRDLSPTALAMFAFGVGLWLVYGIRIHAQAVIFWNGVTFALYCTLFALRVLRR